MSSLNKVMIIGRLGHDPELRYTQSQQPVASFNIATTEKVTKDGQTTEKTEWHRIVAWGKLGELCVKYLKKGSPAYVEGRLHTNSWEKNGEKRYSTEIIAGNIQFLGAKEQDRVPHPADRLEEPPKPSSPPDWDDVPF